MRPDFRYGLTVVILLLGLILPGCSSSSGDDDDSTTPTPDTSPTPPPVVEPRIELTGVVADPARPGGQTVTFVLYGPGGLSADVSAGYSVDGLNYKDISLYSGTRTALAASPTGETHKLGWDSLADLGYANKKIWFRLSASGQGVDLGTIVQQLQINNAAFDKICLVTISPLEKTDGDIPIHYTLSDEAGDRCNVSIKVQRGTLTMTASASTTATSDPLQDVAVTPSGVERVFVWDSLTDIQQFDETVDLVITVKDANNTYSASLTVTVENSPVPDPGELVFSEVLFWPDYTTYVYLEVVNVSSHPLNLRELKLTTTKIPELVLSQGKDLVLNPGDLLLLSNQATTDFVSGLVVAGLVLEKTVETVDLWRGESTSRTIVDSIAYNSDNYGGRDVVRGHALGLSWDTLDAVSNNLQENWCVEQAALPGSTSTSDYGTPNAPTSCSIAPPEQSRRSTY